MFSGLNRNANYSTFWQQIFYGFKLEHSTLFSYTADLQRVKTFSETGTEILKTKIIYFNIIFLSCLQFKNVYSESIGKQIIHIQF